MEEQKYIRKLLENSRKFDIDRYREINFFDTHTVFEGTPRKHPTDKHKIILLTDPFSSKNIFYEFSIDSVGLVEEMGTVTTEEGQSVYRARFWIRKGSPAVRYEPFLVK